MKILSVLSALLFIMSASCKKSQSIKQLSFAQKALNYVQLPLDRYFIYKDSATGNLDSVEVTQSDLSNIYFPAYPGTGLFDPPMPAYYYQEYKLTLTKLNGSTTTWFQGVADANSFEDQAYPSLSPLVFAGSDDIMPYNGVYGYGFEYPQPTSGSGSLIINFPNFTVGNNIYPNVIAFINEGGGGDSTQSGYYKGTYYWAKGIGIVQRTVKISSGTFTSFLERYGN